MQNLIPPQLNLLDKAFHILSCKQKYQAQLKEGIALQIQNELVQNCLQKSFLCCGCMTTQANRLQKKQQMNKKATSDAVLKSRQQNQTLFQLKLNSGKLYIGSWYDIFIFEQWEDFFYNKNIDMKVQPEESSVQSSPLPMNQDNYWYSKISIWFSNEQFKFIFDNKKQHKHVFDLLITLKTYYTKLHPESQYNSLTLRHFVQQNPDKNSHLNRKQITKMMQQMNFPKEEFQKYIQQVPQYKETGTLSRDGFMELIQVLQCPEDLFIIFQKYAKSSLKQDTLFKRYSQKCMSQTQFQKFMKQVQGEQSKDLRDSISFSKYQNGSPKQKKDSSNTLFNQFSFIDFCNIILSNSKNPLIKPKQLDLSKPLPHYYVNSSHNTYLVGNQLTSMSSANVYYLNLIEGMRCVELDIHDGPRGPVIKHGHTFTAAINFDEAIKAIMKFCVQNPDHTPIVLSFQNHCSQKNRIVMATILRRIPFSKFYVIPQEGNNTCKLPTLKQLIGKLVIQGTGVFQQMYPNIVKLQRKNQINENQVKMTDLIYSQALQNNMILNLNNKRVPEIQQKKRQEFLGRVKQLEQRKNKAEQMLEKAQFQILTRNGGSSQQLSKYYGVVAAPFNVNNTCWEMANFAENNLLKMIKGQTIPSAQQIYQYSWNSMIRIYPFGLRFGSSNFNPIPMLQCGCQLVSLNTQSVDVYYVCTQGIFEKNINCGYARKRDVKNQNTKKYRFKIVFMDCIDIRPRNSTMSNRYSCLQVSFLGSQLDMQRNCHYVNTFKHPTMIDLNEPLTISKQFFSKNLQVQLVGIQPYSIFNHPSSIIDGISLTPYPYVQLQITNSQFAHLYINITHCGSMSIPLRDLRKGLRTIPIYRFQIGRRKNMGQILLLVDIQNIE